MIEFHAVMIDETGCEFGVTVRAKNRNEAYERLEEDYPESRVDSLEDPDQRSERERRIEEYAQRCLDDPYYDIDYGDRW